MQHCQKYETTKQVGSWLCRGRRPNFGSLWYCKYPQDFPLQLPSNINLLTLPLNKQAIHLLLPKMKLLPVRLSEKQSEIEKFQRRLQKLEFWRHITKSKYEAILKKWIQHSLSRNEDPIDSSVESVLSLLHGIYTKGCLYRRTVWS